ncbi:MAG: hypothetical protein M3460_05730, partial [Actinomycetota bacterium]|nr:hypothetical protein [Actinomycetota bacterium]
MGLLQRRAHLGEGGLVGQRVGKRFLLLRAKPAAFPIREPRERQVEDLAVGAAGPRAAPAGSLDLLGRVLHCGVGSSSAPHGNRLRSPINRRRPASSIVAAVVTPTAAVVAFTAAVVAFTAIVVAFTAAVVTFTATVPRAAVVVATTTVPPTAVVVPTAVTPGDAEFAVARPVVRPAIVVVRPAIVTQPAIVVVRPAVVLRPAVVVRPSGYQRST